VAVIAAPSALHAQTSLQTCEAVCRDAVDFAIVATSGIAVPHVDSELFAVGIFARKVQQVDTGEDCEESAEQRDGVACVDSVEALEEDERSDEGECGECNVVERVYTVRL
jgi:hypothetical protein